MKNREIHQTFEHSVRFLKEILPEENWVWFLSKNLHGLTEGYPTIPFYNSLKGVTYNFEEIKSFALLYVLAAE